MKFKKSRKEKMALQKLHHFYGVETVKYDAKNKINVNTTM